MWSTPPCIFVDVARGTRVGMPRYRVGVFSPKVGGMVKWLDKQEEVEGRVQHLH